MTESESKMVMFKTTKDNRWVPKGTKVMYDESRDNISKTGKLLCSIPVGGGIFFDKSELILVD